MIIYRNLSSFEDQEWHSRAVHNAGQLGAGAALLLHPEHREGVRAANHNPESARSVRVRGLYHAQADKEDHRERVPQAGMHEERRERSRARCPSDRREWKVI